MKTTPQHGTVPDATISDNNGPDKLFVDARWVASQLGLSLSGAYLLLRDIGAIRLGAKRRAVRVRRDDFDRYIEQRREVVSADIIADAPLPAA